MNWLTRRAPALPARGAKWHRPSTIRTSTVHDAGEFEVTSTVERVDRWRGYLKDWRDRTLLARRSGSADRRRRGLATAHKAGITIVISSRQYSRLQEWIRQPRILHWLSLRNPPHPMTRHVRRSRNHASRHDLSTIAYVAEQVPSILSWPRDGRLLYFSFWSWPRIRSRCVPPDSATPAIFRCRSPEDAAALPGAQPFKVPARFPARIRRLRFPQGDGAAQHLSGSGPVGGSGYIMQSAPWRSAIIALRIAGD